jgi:hypothetical protein
MVDVMIPKWYFSASTTTFTRFDGMQLESMKPIGINRRLSDETAGMTRKVLDAKVSTSNRVGFRASFLVASFLLAILKALTLSTRFRASGIDFKFDGSQSPSQRHQRNPPLMNSSDPNHFRNNGLLFGSFLTKSSISD